MGLVEQKKQLQKEMIPVLYDLIKNWEDEIVEFKEAGKNYKQDEIGQYFSAISNEANLHNLQYGWLVFGVKNKGRSIVGTDYRDTDGLKTLKNEISHNTTGGISFIDIYEVYPVVDGVEKRIIMFQIPAAIAAVPTAWKNLEYGREGESLVPLSQEKRERIRRQTFLDWSKQFVKDATIKNLDDNAIKVARTKYKEKMADEIISDEVDRMSDEEFLEKRRLIVDGKVTNAAMLLLGNEQFDYLMDRMPEASWRVHDSREMVRDYKIFKIPFITLGDRVFENIRNLTYRYMPDRTTLFPAEVKQYDSWILREVLNNCIVHSDYSLGGRIYIHEFDNKLIFTNPGSFIPNSIEALLRPGFTSPFYRNQLLADAMVMFDLIDTEAMGIRKIFYIQKDRYFPLPSYDLSNKGIVEVSVYGEELNDNYMHILYDHPELNLDEVFYLDQVQKGQIIPKEAVNNLRKLGFVEGRVNSLRIKLQVPGIKDDNKERKTHIFTRKENERLRNMIYDFIVRSEGANKSDIFDMLVSQLPEELSTDKKEKKVMNLLTELRKQGRIKRSGVDKKNSLWISAN